MRPFEELLQDLSQPCSDHPGAFPRQTNEPALYKFLYRLRKSKSGPLDAEKKRLVSAVLPGCMEEPRWGPLWDDAMIVVPWDCQHQGRLPSSTSHRMMARHGQLTAWCPSRRPSQPPAGMKPRPWCSPTSRSSRVTSSPPPLLRRAHHHVRWISSPRRVP